MQQSKHGAWNGIQNTFPSSQIATFHVILYFQQHLPKHVFTSCWIKKGLESQWNLSEECFQAKVQEKVLERLPSLRRRPTKQCFSERKGTYVDVDVLNVDESRNAGIQKLVVIASVGHGNEAIKDFVAGFDGCDTKPIWTFFSAIALAGSNSTSELQKRKQNFKGPKNTKFRCRTGLQMGHQIISEAIEVTSNALDSRSCTCSRTTLFGTR